MPIPDTAEHRRLNELPEQHVPRWRRWGPYVADRAWASVREDYSADGDAWQFLPHEKARSKAYRWGEDGIAGLCDRYQVLVFAPAFWNGRDRMLKERLFGVSWPEGNHGEDVKEYYFYLDNTPTHSYMRMLYKYPHAAFPYERLVDENERRHGTGPEFELLDTGVFDQSRYFDIVIEYAKASPDDICIRIEAFNRGPEPAELHVLPHLWFRNTWAWGATRGPEPSIVLSPPTGSRDAIGFVADDRTADPLPTLAFEYRLGPRYLYGPADGAPLFTDNETHAEQVWGGSAKSASPYVKDAFHRHVIAGEASTNPALHGTRAALHYRATIAPGQSAVWRLRLTDTPGDMPLADVDRVIARGRSEADEFYEAIHPPRATADERLVQRQALAGMLWTKQFYLFDVDVWLDGDNPAYPPPASRHFIRNASWRHLNSMRILSMPDTWEYPWFAAWDLAFQAVALGLVDPAFAKENLWLLLFEQFQHPNGQLPAYEWEFSDVHPPVHAWACWRVYAMERDRTGAGDRDFLERCFHKLLINFAWWVNKVDRYGLNVFEGGFLGLDNITVVNRSEMRPDGGVLEQSDASGWMAFFTLSLMRIALELSRENQVYEAMATKFFEHFAYICGAMKKMGGRDYQLWDDADGFFYDVLRFPDGRFQKFRVRSLVGLIPLFAVEIIDETRESGLKRFLPEVNWFIRNRADLVGQASFTEKTDVGTRHVLSVVDPRQLGRVLARVWDPAEFLAPGGLRSLSKHHEQHPFTFGDSEVRYERAESTSKIKGGNSNWRGPIWFPTSFLLIEALVRYDEALRSRFTVDAPNGRATPRQMAEEIANRMIGLFTRGSDGRRAMYGNVETFQRDPDWRDHLLFFEYFDGDDGAGLGANHQTGWTGLVANLIDEWRR